jgi:hypothetical protein
LPIAQVSQSHQEKCDRPWPIQQDLSSRIPAQQLLYLITCALRLQSSEKMGNGIGWLIQGNTASRMAIQQDFNRLISTRRSQTLEKLEDNLRIVQSEMSGSTFCQRLKRSVRAYCRHHFEELDNTLSVLQRNLADSAVSQIGG